ncbi:MAG TPA: alpha-hydroxy acid oxidase [Candidatus Acidoferrales bacterium]|jgi:L-lactate dehydrogenase (cytochrome)|nr:alpha-hydroxy acid oxidase [Candidatus Acidoferrales bacterium]
MPNWPRSLSAPRVVNIADLRDRAQRRLPRAVFDYLDGGAESETSLRENVRAFESLMFRPRNAMAVPQVDTRVKVLGAELGFPAILAPVGYSRLMHPEGECAAARGAGDAGTAYVLSTISGHKLEDVRAATKGPVWYQLYLLGGRAAAEAALTRAWSAGFTALFVTIDTGTAGMRERDIRNGTGQLMGGNYFGMIPHLSQFFTRPGWVASYFLDGGLHTLPNVIIPGVGQMALIDVAAALADSVVTWKDFHWLREVWPGPIVAKGVLTGDDARRAIDVGAAGVVVSNHGGRQLDGVSATLRALPEILRAVNGQVEVLVDGGVRRGGDIVKAICLGARAVLVGRAYAYGMAAAGTPGVHRAIAILRADLERTMKLLGCASISDLDPSLLGLPRDWPGGI